MPDTNPARMIQLMLQRARPHMNGFGSQYIRISLGLFNASPQVIADTVQSVNRSLDWLSEVSETTPTIRAREAAKYKAACELVRARLGWEFGERPPAANEPQLNMDTLIEQFDAFAYELDEAVTFSEVSDNDIAEWLATVDELITSISGSELDHVAKKVLLEAAQVLRKAIVDLSAYGAAACAESIKDALGRILVADTKAKGSEEGKSKITRLLALLAIVAGAVHNVGYLEELPGVIHKGVGFVHALTDGKDKPADKHE